MHRKKDWPRPFLFDPLRQQPGAKDKTVPTSPLDDPRGHLEYGLAEILKQAQSAIDRAPESDEARLAKRMIKRAESIRLLCALGKSELAASEGIMLGWDFGQLIIEFGLAERLGHGAQSQANKRENAKRSVQARRQDFDDWALPIAHEVVEAALVMKERISQSQAAEALCDRAHEQFPGAKIPKSTRAYENHIRRWREEGRIVLRRET
ncbi:hypothetical protein [uncultured Maricaulis sp.]|uniref:hypothetical protein n=1 Tax=uncultured Maricaulis sp. TaxID=174710 RepID=UPI0026370A39|nr:hypothetical protein [uncultured Maricaulis sp.]